MPDTKEKTAPATPEVEEAKTKRGGRPRRQTPSNIGEKDASGFELVGKKDNRVMLKSPTGRFGVYADCWTATERVILRPNKDEALARSVLETGRVPEKAPAKPKGEPKS